MTTRCLIRSVVLFCCVLRQMHGVESPLTSLDYHITGTSLQVSPPVLSVPKGIAGSVQVSVLAGGSTNSSASAQLSSGAYVQAVLRGPAFPTPQRIVAAPNAPLLLPAINLVGDYQLDSIALVDAANGSTRLEGLPSSVPVHVFDQILISTVTSRPLTLDEIQQKGIVIDESNFRAVEFNVSFVLDGKTIPVTFPVVSPQFKDSVELIPADEVEAKLQQAATINQKISSEMVSLPKDLQTANLNIQLQGINFQVVDPGAGQSLALSIPPIPALMVIPGNIGYLHQFFSVKIFTENGAPIGSGLSVDNVQAALQLPPGPDGISAPSYDQPGDDPLRLARIGPNKIIQSTLAVVDPGADGDLGTSDDVSRLQPGQTGQAEFLVEGLQEGLQVMNLDLTADLYGLAAGVVKVKGKAAGSVLVRNPKFSIAFSHPRTVRVSEPYTASVTVLNTGIVPANLVQVNLNKNSISGAVLASDQSETVQLGTILPGQTATATYHMIAQRTGEITFSDLTTSDDSVVGRFRFTMGVDAQGVPLSPDTIAMPDFVNYLPADLVEAANRVLGQALSIATAAQLPPGIGAVNNAIITRRVLDLAEAGQRVQYGDPLNRVLPDLLRDWEGGRQSDDGFDQLLRTSDAGVGWRSVLFADMEKSDHLDGTHRLLDRAADLAGLGQQFVLASAGPGQLRIDYSGGTNNATVDGSSQPYALVYAATNGEWAVTPYLTNGIFTWTFTNGPPAADMAVLLVDTNGQAEQLRWQVSHPSTNAVYRFALDDPSQRLQVDINADGTIDQNLNGNQAVVKELPVALVAVQQDLTVVAGRPANPCGGPPYYNYGTVVAVVFSKPVTQDSAGLPNSYTVDGDNGANSVQVQPSGRVALLNLRKGVSAIRPRKLTVSGVTDVRGNALSADPVPIHSVYPETGLPFIGGVAVRGRVLKGDGTPAAGVPVTLTMYDRVHGAFSCEEWIRRVSQALTDSGGNFDFDFVMSGIGYSLSATDTSGLSPDALKVILDSTIADKPDTQALQQLINASSDTSSLLSLLSANTVPQAVALVEGLDRALVRDVIPIGSGREGQEVPIALRFRGRGSVTGQIVAEDGVTAVPNAAVNLYPDPTSRELGRGVFSDNNGRFAFPAVPLGVFTVDVATSDRRAATVIGLIDSPSQSTNLVIALPSLPVVYGELRGQVFDSDNLTPMANARIFLGKYNPGSSLARDVVRIVDADATGAWQITNAPIQNLDLIAVTFDGSRKGARLGITPVANQITYANITLEAATTVFGQVQFDDGRPATNALVAGGVTLARTDAKGNFQLDGVPVGNAIVSAGLERNPAAGINFPRLGNARLNVIPGAANYVVVKLRPAGRIFGKVFNAQGDLQPNIRVAIPQAGGFYWTDADANGNYVFENLGLGNYTISAPANATSPQINESQLNDQIRSGDEDQILAAFQEALTVFVGSNDPLITGEQQNFRPSGWGYVSTSIPFDGANVNADIRFIPQGTVSGTVLNHQGVPIGARVRLTGLGPDLTGAPVVTIRGEANSDPATGAFNFPLELLAGPWGLQAASPFYPTVLTTNGFTTELDPDVTNIVLRFPPVQEVNGRIAGHVFNPDGSLVGTGVKVHIDISADYQIQTDTNGFFDTQTAFPAIGRGYNVEAFDPSSGRKGRAMIGMTPGITNIVDVHLLSKNSEIDITLLRANGKPASGAQVELDQGSYPYDAPLFGAADTNGVIRFSGLWEGNYAVPAQYTEAATRLSTRGGISVGPNQSAALTLRFGATGSIQGTFVQQDFKTSVLGAQVAIGNLGFATTDTNGFFRFDGVPVGTYQIITSDPITGGNAFTSTTLSYDGQLQTVSLVEATLGTVTGFVLDSYNNGFVPGASVQINFSDGLTPNRTVTTGPNGGFTFPGSPLGAFSLSATYSLPGALGATVSGQGSAVLSSVSNTVSILIQLQPLSYLTVHVVRSDGVTPTQNARVSVGAFQQDTGSDGTVQFINLPVPNSYVVTAISQIGGELHNGTQAAVSVSRGTNTAVTLTLPGVGNVAVTVVASDGVSPVENAELTLQLQAPLFAGQASTALTDAQGRFTFNDLPIGPFLITAENGSLAASENGIISKAGETNRLALRLGESGALLGRVVRADGVTPVGGVDLALDYKSQSENAGRAVFHTGPDGKFRFDNIPVGAIHVASAAPDISGIIDFTTVLTGNGQVLDLGDILFDEDLPQVVQVTPADTAIEVPITNFVDLLFSEPLETNSISPTGIFIRGTNGTVSSTVELLNDANNVQRLVRIIPNSPLTSRNAYEVIVLAGDLPGSGGVNLGSGPRDLVGRAMAAPFVSHFTTADNTPPQLLSIFPSNNAVQIDPSAIPRLSFDKSLRPSGYVFNVSGPHGLVPGTASVGINGQVLSFVPTALLQPNVIYSMVVSNVFDLAGNRAAGEPYQVSFATLDTVGPIITSLKLASNTPAIGGATVTVIATLATNEPGASVRFTQDFNPFGGATNAPFQIAVKLPGSGSTTIRAIASDQYGNDGQFVELLISVQVPQPPAIQFTLLAPTNTAIPGIASVPSGAAFAVEVTASGDTTISSLTAMASGALNGPLLTTNGSRLILEGIVPATATTNELLQILAQATDSVGLSSGQKAFLLPITDATPPSIFIQSPPDQAHLPAGPSFTLTSVVLDNSSNVTLNLVITGGLTLTQNVTVALSPNAAITNLFAIPLTSAPANGGQIIAMLSATDGSSNSSSVTRSFWLPNTVGPAIATLQIASNLPPTAGAIIPVEALLATNQTGISVRFTQDGALLGVVTNAPYKVSVNLPLTGSTVINAVAADLFGNQGVVSTLTINVEPNTRPTLRFVRVSPVTGPLPSDGSFTVNVVPSGNSGFYKISATVGGAGAPLSVNTNGTNLLVQGSVPAAALAGQQVLITAEAIDGDGQSTGLQSLTIPVSDGTKPSLVIQSPAPFAQLTPGQPFQLFALAGDNSSNLTVQLMISGGLSLTQKLALAVAPNTLISNLFTIPVPGNPSNGAPFTALLTAIDVASNITTVARTFWLPGSITTVLWNRQALGQSFTCPNNGRSYTWPNNNNWSQSAQFSDFCGTGDPILISPSNWSSTNYPNDPGLDVVLGGLGDASVNLDALVTLHSLTIQTNGALNMSSPGAGSSITAVNFVFQTDGTITRSSCCSPTLLVLTNGVMDKAAGTNAFTIDSNIILNSFGGTLAVDSGNLVLPGNNSYYTNGAFNVASNATLQLVPGGHTANFAGTFIGSGQGAALLNSGTLNAAGGGLTLDLPASLFQWTGGTLIGNNPLTNAGTINVSGTNGVTLSATLNNTGLLRHSGSGDFLLFSPGVGAYLENLESGTYLLESDAGISRSSCCSPTIFDNYGVLRKSGTSGNSVISVTFNNQEGLVDVQSGTLTLANDGSSSDAAFNVAAGATLDPTGGHQSVWDGTMTGSGAGALLLANGTILGSPGANLNFPNNLFQWAGGTLKGPLTNLNTITISGTNSSTVAQEFDNLGLVRHAGPASLAFFSPGIGTVFRNLSTYQFEGDGGIVVSSCCSGTVFYNSGLVRKSSGTNESRIDGVLFDNLDGSIQVDTGRLTLANNGSSSNGTFTVASGAILDLTGGRSPSWNGLIKAAGAGRVELNSGQMNVSGLTLNCAPGIFQWTGGSFNGTLTNTNAMTISGTNDVLLAGVMYNEDLVRHSGSGNLDLSSPGAGTRFENLASGTYRLESGAGMFVSSCCSAIGFDNYGTFLKIGNSSNSVLSVPFNNLGGQVEVESGTLTLANSGVSSNGIFTVAAGATLDLTGGQNPTWAGQMNGQGAGAILLPGGTLTASPSVALNFVDNLFQWTGGTFSGFITNGNVLMLSGGNDRVLNGQLYNMALIRHAGKGGLGLSSPGAGTFLRNLRGGTYQFETDSTIFVGSCCSAVVFENQGLVRKTGGTNATTISASFNNLGGSVQVDAGRLTLANNGSSSGADFIVAAGASIDLTGGASPSWTGLLNGTGAGHIEFNNGQIFASGLSLNSAPGVFQWTGGTFNGSVSNVQEISISGGVVAGSFVNLGIVRHLGATSLGLSSPGAGTLFRNVQGGTYEFDGDGSISVSSCCSGVSFENGGLLRKSAGTNSVISTPFNNQNGSIEVDRGTLSLGNSDYAEGTGAFTVQLGGTNTSESGRLAARNVTLGGALHVKLSVGFVPVVGAQFQILSCSSLSGTFTTTDVPAGISVNYSSSGVFLIVTGQVKAQSTASDIKGLTIIRDSVDRVTIQWPASSQAILETTSSLGRDPVWLPVQSTPILNNEVAQLPIQVTNSAQFFRLR